MRLAFLIALTAFAQPKLAFEVASIKPNKSVDSRVMLEAQPGGVRLLNYTAKRLLQTAYGVKDFQIAGAPAWANSERYDINGRTESPVKGPELRPILQSLLADRFDLAIHREMKDMPIYALVIAKGGLKIHEASDSDPQILEARNPEGRPSVTRVRRGSVVAQGSTMPGFAELLATFLGRNVIDKTGLSARYDIKLQWTPDANELGNFANMGVPETTDAGPSDGPSLFAALQEQLGLRLEAQRGPVELLVIDKISRPTQN